MEKLKVTKNYKEFLDHYEWNSTALLYMCDALFKGIDTSPFKILPANNSDENVILVYEPENYGLIVTPEVKKAINAWIMQKTNNEPYDIFFSYKMAVEKDD